MSYVYQVLGYVVSNAVSLAAGAVVGYLFGGKAVAAVKYLVGKLVAKL